MSASFYDLLKYAATGIASPDMTYYDKLRASTLMGGVVQTLTGIPPLSFKADGSPLISWSMKGNGSQTGTSTPDAPIMPTFCGVRTAQLFDGEITSQDVGMDSNRYGFSIEKAGTYTIKITGNAEDGDYCYARVYANGEYSNPFYLAIGRATNRYTKTISDGEIIVVYNASGAQTKDQSKAKFARWKIMVNEGDTALPYEPFGWAEKITCAGQTVPVYLGEVPTVRRVKKLALNGKENWIEWKGNYFSSVIDNTAISSSHLFCTHFINDNTVGINIGAGASRLKIASAVVPFVTSVGDLKAWLAAQYAAGTPVIVWYVLSTPETAIVNEPLAKIGDYADELSSTDAAVTIPTVKGQNVLTVDTDLQPSEMTITYKG